SDGLSHIEHEDLTARAHQSGLEHELDGLRYGHEVTRDVGVGHRYGAAGGNLLAKLRDHASGAAEHVAEADHHEARSGTLLQRLAHHLRQSLARAHHVRRIDALGGRDEHEFSNTLGGRRAGHAKRPDHIVAHRLPCVFVFHEGHVLVGGGVEHHGRPVPAQYLLDTHDILDIADRTYGAENGIARREFLFDGIQGILVQFEHHQQSRLEPGDLPAKL